MASSKRSHNDREVSYFATWRTKRTKLPGSILKSTTREKIVFASEDQPMHNAPAENGQRGGTGPDEAFIDLNDQRIRVLPGANDTAASFELEAEDHTLGNALRYIIMKNPEVELCGYSIPHPSEAKMNLRIQTYDGTTAYDALEKGLDDLMGLCNIVIDNFMGARDDFKATNKT